MKNQLIKIKYLVNQEEKETLINLGNINCITPFDNTKRALIEFTNGRSMQISLQEYEKLVPKE